MPGWLKALLTAAIIVVLLIVGMVGAGVFWWMRTGRALRAHGQDLFVEGRAFGHSTDNQGCVDESVSRYRKDPGRFSALNHGRFMEGCLETSRPTPQFCDDIPNGDMMRMAAWRDAQCQRYGLANDGYCGYLFMSEVMYCGNAKRAPS